MIRANKTIYIHSVISMTEIIEIYWHRQNIILDNSTCHGVRFRKINKVKVGLGLIINTPLLVTHGQNKNKINLLPLIKILKEVPPYRQQDLRWPVTHLREIGLTFTLIIYKVQWILKISIISHEIPRINLLKQSLLLQICSLQVEIQKFFKIKLN